MKKHELYKYVDIIKESPKAVCIKNTEIDDAFGQILNQSLAYRQCYVNRKPFWIPKSQIEIKNNQIVAITKWMYNQLIFYVDCPICLKEDVDDLKEHYNTIFSKRIAEETRINNMINKRTE